jgi:hypothetical protein
MEAVVKTTKFLFDLPVTKDWLFYVFLIVLAGNVINGLSNVSASGGFTTSGAGMLSGLLDGAFRVLLSWFPIVPIIYFIRKLIRKSKKDKSAE